MIHSTQVCIPLKPLFSRHKGAGVQFTDEPTGNLDPKNSLDIMNLLEDINKRGTTVVVVTHNKDIVNEMKKRVITLKKGVIISDEKEGGYIDED